LVPARADPQEQAPVAHLIGGDRPFGEDRRVAGGIAQDQRADLDALCRLGQRPERGPALPKATGWVTSSAIEEVVSEPDAIEAVRLCLLGDGADRIIRALAIVCAIVCQEDHQPDLHRLPSAFFGVIMFALLDSPAPHGTAPGECPLICLSIPWQQDR